MSEGRPRRAASKLKFVEADEDDDFFEEEARVDPRKAAPGGEQDGEEEEEEDNTPYCICRGKDDGSFMICCDKCNEWYHGRCIKLAARQGKLIDSFICHKCRGIPLELIVQAHGLTPTANSEADYQLDSEEEEEEEEDEASKKRKRAEAEKTTVPQRTSNSTPPPTKRVKTSESPEPAQKTQKSGSLSLSGSVPKAHSDEEVAKLRGGAVDNFANALLKDKTKEEELELRPQATALAQQIEEAVFALSNNQEREKAALEGRIKKDDDAESAHHSAALALAQASALGMQEVTTVPSVDGTQPSTTAPSALRPKSPGVPTFESFRRDDSKHDPASDAAQAAAAAAIAAVAEMPSIDISVDTSALDSKFANLDNRQEDDKRKEEEDDMEESQLDQEWRANRDDNVYWQGRISYPGVFEEFRVNATHLSGEKVPLHLFPATFVITNRVGLTEILQYLPQLDRSSSRQRSVLYLDPGTHEDTKTYDAMISHLDSIKRACVVVPTDIQPEPLDKKQRKQRDPAVLQSLAKEAQEYFREIYIIPITADAVASGTLPEFFTKDYPCNQRDRLMLVLVTAKKGARQTSASVTASPALQQSPSVGANGLPVTPQQATAVHAMAEPNTGGAPAAAASGAQSFNLASYMQLLSAVGQGSVSPAIALQQVNPAVLVQLAQNPAALMQGQVPSTTPGATPLSGAQLQSLTQTLSQVVAANPNFLQQYQQIPQGQPLQQPNSYPQQGQR